MMMLYGLEIKRDEWKQAYLSTFELGLPACALEDDVLTAALTHHDGCLSACTGPHDLGYEQASAALEQMVLE